MITKYTNQWRDRWTYSLWRMHIHMHHRWTTDEASWPKRVWLAIWNKSDLFRFNSFANRWRYALVSDVRRGLPIDTATEFNRKGRFSLFFSFCVPTVSKGYSLPASCKKHTTYSADPNERPCQAWYSADPNERPPQTGTVLTLMKDLPRLVQCWP